MKTETFFATVAGAIIGVSLGTVIANAALGQGDAIKALQADRKATFEALIDINGRLPKRQAERGNFAVLSDGRTENRVVSRTPPIGSGRFMETAGPPKAVLSDGGKIPVYVIKAVPHPAHESVAERLKVTISRDAAKPNVSHVVITGMKSGEKVKVWTGRRWLTIRAQPQPQENP